MSVLWFLLIGLCAGWLAGKVVKGNSFGLIGNLVVGAIGAVLGGFLFEKLGVSESVPFGELLAAIVGAIIVLLILRLIDNRRG